MLGFTNPIKSFWDQIKQLMNEGKGLMDQCSDLKAAYVESPETEELIERLSASDNGKFVLNSGVLTPEEIASLSRPQLAKFLLDGIAGIETFGKEFYAELAPQTRKKFLKKLAKRQNSRNSSGT